MKKGIIVICCLLLVLIVEAQSWKELPLNVGYFGENVIHPGLIIGTEYTVWEKDKTKKRWLFNRNETIGPKTKTKQLFVAGNVGFYNAPNNHTGIFLSSELGYRRTNNRKGTFYGTSLGIGYLQRIYNIPTYTLGATEPDKINGGQAQMMAIFSISIGRDLSYRRDIPISWYVKPTVWLGMPQAHTAIPNAALDLGIRYQF
jgi:hypothetical protein